MPYEPQEDSALLQGVVRQHARGRVLDMGTGSGIQAKAAAQLKRVKEVIAVDVDEQALAWAKKHSDHPKITWRKSDLFAIFKNKKYRQYFDSIIFNAPYLPQEGKLRDVQLEGGKRGHETIERFLKEARNFLKPTGTILLVCSSLTPEMKRIVQENLYERKIKAKKHIFFEDILVCVLKRSSILNRLEKRGMENIEFFAYGKRGMVFTGKYKRKRVAVKVKRPGSMATRTITHEANILKEVNRHNLGPKYLFHSKNFLVYKFAEGVYLKDLIGTKRMKAIAKKVFEKCYQLDQLGIDKQEWTRPLKHVIVKDSNITLIDWERARKTKQPHNVTQFAVFAMRHVAPGKRWINIAKQYRSDPSREHFEKLVGVLG